MERVTVVGDLELAVRAFGRSPSDACTPGTPTGLPIAALAPAFAAPPAATAAGVDATSASAAIAVTSSIQFFTGPRVVDETRLAGKKLSSE